MTRAIGGRLYLAPVTKEKINSILDIGTGTGVCEWCHRSCLTNVVANLCRGDRDR